MTADHRLRSRATASEIRFQILPASTVFSGGRDRRRSGDFTPSGRIWLDSLVRSAPVINSWRYG